MENDDLLQRANEVAARILEALGGPDNKGVPPAVAVRGLLEAAAGIATTMLGVKDRREFLRIAGEAWDGPEHEAKSRPIGRL